MSENLSSVEANEALKMEFKKRAQEKLANNPELYEKRAAEWKDRVEKAGLEIPDNLSPETVAMRESAREWLIESNYLEEDWVDLSGEVSLTKINNGAEPVEGKSRDGVEDAAKHVLKESDEKRKLYVIPKLDDEAMPTSEYEAFVLSED